MTPLDGTLDDLLREDRTFPPPEAFRESAHVTDDRPRDAAGRDPDAYWEKWASELHWFRRWDTVVEWGAAVRPVVRRGPDQRVLQLPGSTHRYRDGQRRRR